MDLRHWLGKKPQAKPPAQQNSPQQRAFKEARTHSRQEPHPHPSPHLGVGAAGVVAVGVRAAGGGAGAAAAVGALQLRLLASQGLPHGAPAELEALVVHARRPPRRAPAQPPVLRRGSGSSGSLKAAGAAELAAPTADAVREGAAPAAQSITTAGQ